MLGCTRECLTMRMLTFSLKGVHFRTWTNPDHVVPDDLNVYVVLTPKTSESRFSMIVVPNDAQSGSFVSGYGVILFCAFIGIIVALICGVVLLIVCKNWFKYEGNVKAGLA